MTDIAASAAFATGKQALNILNKWLDDKEIAKSWYGKDHKKFTGLGKWPLNKSFRLTIKHVFTVKKDDWQKVIEYCLPDCYTWCRRTEGGECCWLRIYKSLPENMRGEFLQKPASSLQSLSIVESLPAARIDLWGLVVLAFANGAEQSVRVGSTGSFVAKLSAIDFIITIWQYDMAGPICAHLEPREKFQAGQTMLTSPEWNNLLWRGHTFRECDHVFGWPLSSQLPEEAPDDLTTNVLNAELALIIMDDQWAQQLQNQLRRVIRTICERWDELERLMKREGFPVRGHEVFMDRIPKIRRHLLAFKLLLVDESLSPKWIVEEQRREDSLSYAQNQLNTVAEEITNLGADEHISSEDLEALRKHLQDGILPLQKMIVALVRLLTLPTIVKPQLSTRGTGIHVSLA